MRVRTHSTSDSTIDAFPEWDIGFHGEASDSRGQAAVDAMRSRCAKAIPCIYDREQLRSLRVAGARVHARDMVQLFEDRSARYVLEASTLELVELLHLLRAAKRAKIPTLDLLYAEPQTYRREALSLESAWARGFSLSENSQFEGVPGFTVDLTQEASGSSRLVAFLGYEGARFAQALQRLENLAECPKSVVFGIPGYAAGWELNALANNVASVAELRHASVSYCAAASVSGALRILERIFDGEGSQIVIAPLGTKPHTIAAAIFLVEHSECQESTLIWDHPVAAQGRSSEVRRWHRYQLTVDYDTR